MKKILYFILVMLSCSLAFSQVKIEEYSPQKNIIDTNIRKINLVEIERIKLEENSENILQNIYSSSIDPINNNIAVTDLASKNLYIYDFSNGDLLKTIIPDITFSDLIANSGKQPYDFQEHGIDISGYSYIASKDYDKYNMNLHSRNSWKSNSFTFCSFYDSLLFTTALVYIPSKKLSTFPDKNTHLTGNSPLIIIYNHNIEIIDTITIELKPYAHPGSEGYYFDNVNGLQYLVTPDFQRIYSFGKEDSLSTLMEFDKDGNQIRKVHYLPEKFLKSGAFYDTQWKPIFKMIDNQLFILLTSDNTMYGIDNQIYFKLQNQIYDNDKGFNLYKYYKEFVKKNGNNKSNFGILNKLFPVVNLDFFELQNGNIGLIQLIFDVENDPLDYYIYIQEYTKDGILKKHCFLYNDEYGKLYNFTYDKTNNILAVIKKNSVGWILEKRKWE